MRDILLPLPALILGIMAMRDLGVGTSAWSINIAAAILGLVIRAIGRRLPAPERPTTQALLTGAVLAAILLPFAFEGMLGVHRWIPIAGLRLHAAAIVAPLIVACVAAAKAHRALAIGAAATLILALQPDAAQAVSLAAACAVVLARKPAHVAVLVAVAAISFVRPDPLPPLAHVEGIFSAVSSRGPAFAAMATVALLLLPLPFFIAWHRHRRVVALALGLYVTMTVLAPAWGTFPVPVMGYGASPILGYFIALAIAGRGQAVAGAPRMA